MLKLSAFTTQVINPFTKTQKNRGDKNPDKLQISKLQMHTVYLFLHLNAIKYS